MAYTNKALIALVAGMGVVILLGFGALIAGLILKATAPKMIMPAGIGRDNTITKNINSATSQLSNINLPTGHLVKNIGLSDTKIIIHTSQKSGVGGVFIIDGETGVILRRFNIGSAP